MVGLYVCVCVEHTLPTFTHTYNEIPHILDRTQPYITDNTLYAALVLLTSPWMQRDILMVISIQLE